MKKRLWLFAALLALLPLGVAVAEYADGDPGAPAEDVHGLLEVAQKVMGSVVKARSQLVRATDTARKNGDVLLASCLSDKLERIKKLELMARKPFEELQHAPSAAVAQRPYVVLTVIGQKVAVTLQEAAACVDSKNTNGEVTIEMIAPPEPPEGPELPFDTDTGFDVPPVEVLPLPPAPPGTTDLNPSTDEPPPVASPMR